MIILVDFLGSKQTEEKELQGSTTIFSSQNVSRLFILFVQRRGLLGVITKRNLFGRYRQRYYQVIKTPFLKVMMSSNGTVKN